MNSEESVQKNTEYAFGAVETAAARACGDLPLAMAFVAFQCWEEPYELSNALCRGTVFPALDMPFLGRRIAR